MGIVIELMIAVVNSFVIETEPRAQQPTSGAFNSSQHTINWNRSPHF